MDADLIEDSVRTNLNPFNQRVLKDKVAAIDAMSAEKVRAELAAAKDGIIGSTDTQEVWIANLYAMQLRERMKDIDAGQIKANAAAEEAKPEPPSSAEVVAAHMDGLRTEAEELRSKTSGYKDISIDEMRDRTPEEEQAHGQHLAELQRLSALNGIISKYEVNEKKYADRLQAEENHQQEMKEHEERLAAERRPD